MGILRDYVQHAVNSFEGVFKLDHDPGLSEEENVERVIHQTAFVSAILSCVQPIPMADIIVLAPLQAKMTLHIGRIKGFDISQERALDIVKEILGVTWLHLGTQLVISGLLKITWAVGMGFLGLPFNYAATYAIGRVVTHYFDALRRGDVPSAQVMRDLFVEQFRVGKQRGESLDRSDLEQRAEALRKKVAESDPELATSTRLRSREAPADRPASGSATAAARGERQKIKIELDPRASTAPADAPSAPSKGKTFGPAGPAAPVGAPPAGAGKTIFAADAPAPPPADLARQVRELEAMRPKNAELAALIEDQVSGCAEALASASAAESAAAPGELEEMRRSRVELEQMLAQARLSRDQFAEASREFDRDLEEKRRALAAAAPAQPAHASGPAPPGDLISKLERLARLREQGVLSQDEFDQAKRQLLA